MKKCCCCSCCKVWRTWWNFRGRRDNFPDAKNGEGCPGKNETRSADQSELRNRKKKSFAKELWKTFKEKHLISMTTFKLTQPKAKPSFYLRLDWNKYSKNIDSLQTVFDLNHFFLLHYFTKNVLNMIIDVSKSFSFARLCTIKQTVR
jgi:hypothetical protein